jgi:non-lysosomal glucosylceramidase
LWLAALEAAIAIGQVLIDRAAAIEAIPDTLATFQTWLTQSRPVYETLWNGQYYRLDTGSGSDVVMADQLCGQFYARLLGLPDIVPLEQARSALKTVYDACFLKFHNGQFGAANGVRPDGSAVNPNDTHPLEVWTGINFGLAAFLIQMEMRDEAFASPKRLFAKFTTTACNFAPPKPSLPQEPSAPATTCGQWQFGEFWK